MRCGGLALLSHIVLLCVGLAACGDEVKRAQVLTGDPERGRLLLRQYACAACHTIPGVATASGNVGPPLTNIADRVYLGGILPNTPENMARWIRAPQEVDPLTAMPDMQVPEPHVRDMIAYLYRMR